MYNGSKPNKWHTKDFALCCALTGYLLRFHPYQGKDEKRPQGMGLAEFAVRSVLTEEFWDKGHMLGFDNWFTSEGSVNFSAEKCNVTATVRAGRKGFPCKAELKHASKAERGAVKAFRHPYKALYVSSWKDNKEVVMMSTFPFDMGTCPRADKKSSSHDKKDVYQPSHNAVYNECMPGVDLHDQFTAYIRAFLRSRKALKAFMLGKVFSCVSNARIILNELNPEKKKISIYTAGEQLAVALIHSYLEAR
jgi:hypothetical protein